MVQAVDQFFPQEISYVRPKGGFFLWVQLPETQNAWELLEDALAEKVTYVPGAPFYPNGGGEHTLRLSYSLASKTEIKTGVQKLGAIFEQALVHNNVLVSQ